MALERTNWRLIALLWTTGLMAAAQFAKVTLTLGSLAEAYASAPVAYLVSAVAVIGVLGGAVAGSVVARLGARRVVLAAVCISAAMSAVQFLPLPFSLFLLSRIVEGVGHLGLVVALPTLMAAVAEPKDRSVVMGLWGTFFGVGFSLFALAVPSLVNAGGPQLVFGVHGLLLAALFPVLWWALPRVITPDPARPNILEIHRTIYANPRLFAPGVGHGIYASLFIAMVAYLPAAMSALWLTAVLPLANLLGTFVAGFIARRVPAGRVSVLGFITSGVLLAVMAATGSAIVALIAFFATGITAGANFAAVPELNARSEDQARANGAMAQMGNVGTFSGTPLFALVAVGGLWSIAGLGIAICVLGAVAAGWGYAAAARR